MGDADALGPFASTSKRSGTWCKILPTMTGNWASGSRSKSWSVHLSMHEGPHGGLESPQVHRDGGDGARADRASSPSSATNPSVEACTLRRSTISVRWPFTDVAHAARHRQVAHERPVELEADETVRRAGREVRAEFGRALVDRRGRRRWRRRRAWSGPGDARRRGPRRRCRGLVLDGEGDVAPSGQSHATCSSIWDRCRG